MDKNISDIGKDVMELLVKQGLTDEEIKKVLLSSLEMTLMEQGALSLKDKLMELENQPLFDDDND